MDKQFILNKNRRKSFFDKLKYKSVMLDTKYLL